MRQSGNGLRRAVRHLHLWLGLSLGGLLVLLGVTGSILVFYPEIDAMLHPEIRVASAGAPDWDAALATLRKAYPDKPGTWRFEATGEPGAIPARYYKPGERAHHAFRPLMVWLSPDGGTILRRDYWGEYAMTFVYDLHYRLLLGKVGGEILGWLGFGMLALLVTGLWAWWPRGSWVKALRIKRRAPPQRALRDWHKLAGLIGLTVLPVLVVTGIMLELPDESGVALASIGLATDPAPPVAADKGRPVIAPSQAVAAARRVLPAARLAWIETPAAAGGTYRLRMQVPDDPSPRFPHSYVWIDAATGRVLAITDAGKASGGSVVMNWLHPLHDGSAFGLAGRMVIALAGLLPAMLFLTGWWRWRMRRRGAWRTRRASSDQRLPPAIRATS